MRVFKNLSISFVVLWVLIFSMSSSGFGGEVGVTDDTIIIGGIFDLSGPLTFAGTPESHAINMYLKRINEQGGIHGRKFKFVFEDDGYQVPRTVAAYRKLTGQDGIFALVLGSGSSNMNAVTPLAEKDKLPAFPSGGSKDPRIPPKRYLFHTGTMYSTMGHLIIDYIADVLAKGKKPRIAHIAQDDASGEAHLEGIKESLQQHGLTLTEGQRYKRLSVDFSSYISKVHQANAEYVIIDSALREAAAMLNEAKKYTWNPEPQFIAISFATDNKLFNLVDQDDRFVKKLIGTAFVAMVDGDSPGAVDYRSCLQKYDPKYEPSNFALFGWGKAMLLTEAIRKAGRDLTKEKLVDAIESMKNFDAAGIFPPMNFSSTDRIGPKGCYFLRVEKNRFVKLTDWILLK